MKTTSKLITLMFTFLALTASAYAQSPREELKQMVEQLQKTPTDNALRERIVKLGPEIKPPPAIPEEANRREGRGKFAFRSAKSNDDFLGAAAEFEAAVKAAPWVAGYYSDLCTIYEKAEKYAEAKRNCELYLASLADPAQISEVRQRIAGIEFGIEKATKKIAAKSNDDLLIVPGQRLGKVSIGMSQDKLLEVLGQPSRTVEMTPRWRNYWWNDTGLLVKVISNNVENVVTIESAGKQYRTGQGLGMGASESEIRSRLGEPQRSGPLNKYGSSIDIHIYCYRSGVQVSVQNGKVDYVEVFRPSGFDDNCPSRSFAQFWTNN